MSQTRRGPSALLIIGLVFGVGMFGVAGYLGYKRFLARPAATGVAEGKAQSSPAAASAQPQSDEAKTARMPATVTPAQPSSAVPPAATAVPPSPPVASANRPAASAVAPKPTGSLPSARSQTASAPRISPAAPSVPATTTPAPTAAAPSAPAAVSSQVTPSTQAAVERPSVSSTPSAGMPSPASERPTILKPEREVTPAQAQTSPPSPTRPAGPSSGIIVWSGELRRGQIITIEGAQASSGTLLQGELPGVPVLLETDFQAIGFTEMPGPSNGWKRVSFRALRDQKVVITLRWRTFQ